MSTLIMMVMVAALVSAAATWAVLGYARHRLVDSVNERSSHSIAKPRGGGLGLVIGMLVAWTPVACWSGAGLSALLLGLAIIGISALGWWDDHCQLSARFRLPLQILLAGLVLAGVGIPTDLPLVGSASIPVAMWWFIPAAVMGCGWMINLTNFMDGIDGIAATQGVIGCVTLGLLMPPQASEVCLLLWACAAACVGFLLWNYPPAKIFMGDVGSTALGLVFAIGLLEGIRHGIPLEEMLLPLAPFIADATCTLARRAWRRESLPQAHRSHLYQRLSKHWESHLHVTALYAGLALLGAGLAWCSHQRLLPSGLGLIIWGVIWGTLVLHGRRVCPAFAYKDMSSQ